MTPPAEVGETVTFTSRSNTEASICRYDDTTWVLRYAGSPYPMEIKRDGHDTYYVAQHPEAKAVSGGPFSWEELASHV